jgi:ubiquinone/menaquinone biosynthesis C-methylase UbiE
MAALVKGFGWGSVLDVGCGTGRTLRGLTTAVPGLQLFGVEPVAEMLKVARANLPVVPLVVGSGQHLPFPDASFDVVCAFATLHHVEDPAPVVAEMMRVGRRALFINDSNRFGTGYRSSLAKLVLYRMGLWPLAFRLRTGGRGYGVTDRDGISYSYSIYDSLNQVRGWAKSVFLVPIDNNGHSSWLHPLLTSRSAMLVAIR